MGAEAVVLSTGGAGAIAVAAIVLVALVIWRVREHRSNKQSETPASRATREPDDDSDA